MMTGLLRGIEGESKSAELGLYEVAWRSFAKLRAGQMHVYSEETGFLEYLYNQVISSKEELPILLYNRNVGVGFLLASYVLEKLKRPPTKEIENIDRIIKIIKKYSWYDYDGETLYALTLLSTAKCAALKNVDITALLKDQFDHYLRKLTRFNITARDLENLLFITLALINTGEYVERHWDQLLKVVTNEFIKDKAHDDLNVIGIYGTALSELVIKAKIKRMVKLVRNHEFRLLLKSTLKHINDISKTGNLRLDISAKLELAKYSLEIANKKILKISRLRSLKLQYAIYAFAIALLMYLIPSETARIAVVVLAASHIAEALFGKNIFIGRVLKLFSKIST